MPEDVMRENIAGPVTGIAVHALMGEWRDGTSLMLRGQP
jgi:hypothetical protein